MSEVNLVDDDAWVRGEDEEFEVQILNSLGAAEDLSDAISVELEIKRADGDPDPALIHLAIGSGLTLRTQTGANIGWLDGLASAAQTEALAAGRYRFDVFVVRSDNLRKRAIHGILQVRDTPNWSP